jgi:DNA (cytosine-5)-methyltransferase 1
VAAYYNEFDPFAAAWLRELIKDGLIADGEVDQRSIKEVAGSDLAGFRQCHFFAGIGGWSYALRLAGWDDDRPVWTGSCPCQPFSLAGSQKGFADERHLWPILLELIGQRRPAIFFGEQVASAGAWLRTVRGDLEALDYAVGAIPMEAASAGADHLRDRYWIVANSTRERQHRGEGASRSHGRLGIETGSPGVALGDACSERLSIGPVAEVQRGNVRDEGTAAAAPGVGSLTLADTDQSDASEEWQQRSREQRGLGSDPQVGPLSDSAGEQVGSAGQPRECERLEWVIGGDGKARRVKPGVRLLAHGVPGRVGKLRGFGNAIDPRPAAAFIQAADEAMISLQPQR